MPTITWSNLTSGGTGHTTGARSTYVIHNRRAYIADGYEMLIYDYVTDALMTMGIPAYTGTPTLTADGSGTPALTIPSGFSVYGKVTYHDNDMDAYGNPCALLELAGTGAAVKVVFGNLTASADARVDRIQCWMTVPKPTGTFVEAADFFLVGEAVDTTTSQSIDLTEEEISAGKREALEVPGVAGGRWHDAPRRAKYIAAYDTGLWATGITKNRTGVDAAQPTKLYRAPLGKPDVWDDSESKELRRESTGQCGLEDELLIFSANETYAIVGKGNRMEDYTLVVKSEDVGCVSQYSVRMYSDGTGAAFPVWLSRKGVYAYRGGQFLNLTEKYLSWFDKATMKWNENYTQYAQAGVSMRAGRYYLSLPLAGSTKNNFELVYNRVTGGFEVWKGRCTPDSGIGIQWYGRFENEDQEEVVLMADNLGNLYYERENFWSDGSTAIDLDFRTMRTNFGGDGQVKRLTSIELAFDDANTSATSVDVQVLEDRDTTAKPTTPVTVAVSDFTRPISISASGRQLQTRIRENTANKSLRVDTVAMKAAILPFGVL